MFVFVGQNSLIILKIGGKNVVKIIMRWVLFELSDKNVSQQK